MDDSEALNLTEYYHWAIMWDDSGNCVLVTNGGNTEPTPSLRQGIARALRKQAEWAMATQDIEG